MKVILFTFLLLLSVTALAETASEQSLADYRSVGAGPFNAETGKQLWLSVTKETERGIERSCTDCHGNNLNLSGKHLRTGKPIEPMAPVVTSHRLTDKSKIEKWFKRNCKWTFGRECTPQEKGDLILFIQQQNK
ncbi:MAG: DUF1924 domain-containing protein [Sedimenticola sp.]|nr:DUF1924 domain-containing protein [Sedimenticola sp.]